MEKYRCKGGGFTLIEIMLVVTVVGILSGISISIINQAQQQNRAKDAIAMVSLTKAVSAIESCYYGEGSYPSSLNATTPGNPLTDPGNASLSVYLKTWPSDFFYLYDAASGSFAIYVKRNVDGNYYKFRSTTEAISLCKDTTPNL